VISHTHFKSKKYSVVLKKRVQFLLHI